MRRLCLGTATSAVWGSWRTFGIAPHAASPSLLGHSLSAAWSQRYIKPGQRCARMNMNNIVDYVVGCYEVAAFCSIAWLLAGCLG